MNMNESIRQAAQKALTAKGWTQQQWADQAGVRQATASRFLSGKRNDAAEAAIKLLEALGLELVVREKCL